MEKALQKEEEQLPKPLKLDASETSKKGKEGHKKKKEKSKKKHKKKVVIPLVKMFHCGLGKTGWDFVALSTLSASLFLAYLLFQFGKRS